MIEAILTHRDDAYRVLGVEKSASEEQIKRGHKKLALALHPDKNSAPDAVEAFQVVQKAYETLKDTKRRELYDIGGYGAVQRHDDGGFPGVRVVLRLVSVWYAGRFSVPSAPRRKESAFASEPEVSPIAGVFSIRLWLLTMAAMLIVCTLCGVCCGVKRGVVCSVIPAANTRRVVVDVSGTTFALHTTSDCSGIQAEKVVHEHCAEERRVVAASLQRMTSGIQKVRAAETFRLQAKTLKGMNLGGGLQSKPWRSRFDPEERSVLNAHDLARLSHFCS